MTPAAEQPDLNPLRDAARHQGADDTVLGTLAHVLDVSPFIARQAGADAAFWQDLLPILQHRYAPDEMEQRLRRRIAVAADPLSELDHILRIFRRHEIIRIAWRDLCGWADTTETLRDLSDLADHCVQVALEVHEQALIGRHGTPRDEQGVRQHLVVLGMGKLGGRELNYSSDIDLIFSFPSEGETDGERGMANSQFFIRLGQRIIRSLNDVTADGFVFRVDMRLRPHGDEGPLALSFDAMELYYTTLGREWERYAFIKARVIAGDKQTGQQLMDMLRPFVFRRYLDFGAFAQLREMKRMIEREMARKGMRDNIKLGPGGIREIEFVGQLFQLLRGGREPRLQARGILTVLDELVVLGELPQSVVADLQSGYDFLRRTENRLQMMHDQQTQTLPAEPDDQGRLTRAMGYEQWTDFLHDLDRHRQLVHHHFGEVLRLPDDDARSSDPLERLWQGQLEHDAAIGILTDVGFREPESAWEILIEWRDRHAEQSSATVSTRLNALIPALIRVVASTANPLASLSRVLELISQVLSRSVYLALLIEQPQALHQLVRLCAVSPWIAELLTQHPILLDELIDPTTLYDPPDRQALTRELAGILEKCGDDHERQIDELRRFRQLAVLRVAAADVIDAIPLMKISDLLTWIAEVILEAVLKLAWGQLVARHGIPRCRTGEDWHEPGLAIIGYGKLGGIELGYGSDLDLVFLHDSTGEDQMTDGPKPIDNSLFFARLAQKIIHLLSIRTPAGVLYEVDTRLRPDGAAGLLVSSMNAFEAYQREHAWLWEIQALCRARYVAGHTPIAERFAAIRAEMIRRPRDPEELRRRVVDMRAKMRQQQSVAPAGMFHLKKGVGGITDIEFLVQYLLLLHAAEQPEILRFTDNIRQLESLVESGRIEPEIADGLIQAYRQLRDAGHEQVLRGETNTVDAQRFQAERDFVCRAWQQIIGQPPPA